MNVNLEKKNDRPLLEIVNGQSTDRKNHQPGCMVIVPQPPTEIKRYIIVEKIAKRLEG